MVLKISEKLTLPDEAVTSTFGLLALRGAGKSNAARVMAEEMFRAGLPFVYIDPVGSAFGLRSGRDGKPNGGLLIPIFGGRHGDVPLERGAGELIADLIIERRLSCVVDVSTLESEGDKKTFLLAFARRLYQKNQDPLHLFLEEADDYISQKPMRDELQLLRAWENIVRRGRARGLGCTIITQRSAAVNKMVLTQVETLFVLRTTGPQDIAAIEAWTKYHQVGSELLKSLAGLEDGEAWAWSPHFLKTPATRFQFRRCDTFDSGATPKNVRGADARKVATLADVDLQDLRGRIAETVERAKRDDPKALRAEISRLERELAKKEVPIVKTNIDNLATMVRYLQELIAQHDDCMKKSQSVEADLRVIREDYDRLLKLVQKTLQEHGATADVNLKRLTPTEPPPTERSARLGIVGADNNYGKSNSTNGLSKCASTLLAVLAQFYPHAITKGQLAVLSSYSAGASTMANGLTELRVHGYIDGRGKLAASDLGKKKAASRPPLPPAGPKLIEFWQARLSKCAAELLGIITDAYPRVLTKDQLEKLSPTGYSAGASTMANGLTELRNASLIEGRGSVKATRWLMEKGGW